MKKKIIITGFSGLLGSHLCNFLSKPNYEVFKVGRSKDTEHNIDIANFTLLKKKIREIKPDIFINLVALTDVDNCEKNLDKAFHANSLIPMLISQALKELSFNETHFIQISTDQVYDGSGNHNENEVFPINIYGLTKLTGEKCIQFENNSILRCNFFGKSKSDKKSFSDWIVSSMLNKSSITLFNDVIFNALHINTLCQIIDYFISYNLKGTYNIGCCDSLNKADFANKLASQLGLTTKNAKIGSVFDLGLYARRPLNMTMNIEKIEKYSKLKMPSIHDELQKLAEDYM